MFSRDLERNKGLDRYGLVASHINFKITFKFFADIYNQSFYEIRPAIVIEKVPFKDIFMDYILNFWGSLSEQLLNPFMNNVGKWPNILQKSCVVHSSKFLKYVWLFFNILHEDVQYPYSWKKQIF